MNDQPETRRSRRNQQQKPAVKPRSKATVTGVLGELLLTAGVVVLLFVAWQMWIGDMIKGAQNNQAGATVLEQWADLPDDAIAPPVLVESDDGTAAYYAPPVIEPVASGETFGVLRVPRFGDNYSVEIRGGVDPATSLNVGKVGHYPDTQMPGDTGNFAVAAHRGSHGGPFMTLPGLRIGDAIVVETPDGWYTYRFRNLEYVEPSAGDVLLPVPRELDTVGIGKYLTMTTCSPRYGWDERAIAYAEFDFFTPRSLGEPASLQSVPKAEGI